jgi:hypothetical protein
MDQDNEDEFKDVGDYEDEDMIGQDVNGLEDDGAEELNQDGEYVAQGGQQANASSEETNGDVESELAFADDDVVRAMLKLHGTEIVKDLEGRNLAKSDVLETAIAMFDDLLKDRGLKASQVDKVVIKNFLRLSMTGSAKANSQSLSESEVKKNERESNGGDLGDGNDEKVKELEGDAIDNGGDIDDGENQVSGPTGQGPSIGEMKYPRTKEQIKKEGISDILKAYQAWQNVPQEMGQPMSLTRRSQMEGKQIGEEKKELIGLEGSSIMNNNMARATGREMSGGLGSNGAGVNQQYQVGGSRTQQQVYGGRRIKISDITVSQAKELVNTIETTPSETLIGILEDYDFENKEANLIARTIDGNTRRQFVSVLNNAISRALGGVTGDNPRLAPVMQEMRGGEYFGLSKGGFSRVCLAIESYERNRILSPELAIPPLDIALSLNGQEAYVYSGIFAAVVAGNVDLLPEDLVQLINYNRSTRRVLYEMLHKLQT